MSSRGVRVGTGLDLDRREGIAPRASAMKWCVSRYTRVIATLLRSVRRSLNLLLFIDARRRARTSSRPRTSRVDASYSQSSPRSRSIVANLLSRPTRDRSPLSRVHRRRPPPRVSRSRRLARRRLAPIDPPPSPPPRSPPLDTSETPSHASVPPSSVAVDPRDKTESPSPRIPRTRTETVPRRPPFDAPFARPLRRLHRLARAHRRVETRRNTSARVSPSSVSSIARSSARIATHRHLATTLARVVERQHADAHARAHGIARRRRVRGRRVRRRRGVRSRRRLHARATDARRRTTGGTMTCLNPRLNPSLHWDMVFIGYVLRRRPVGSRGRHPAGGRRGEFRRRQTP